MPGSFKSNAYTGVPRVPQSIPIVSALRLFSPAQLPPGRLSERLVSFWELEETTGTRYDSVDASGNHLTSNNTVLSAVGKVNTAAQLTLASSQSLSRVSNASLQTGDIDQTVCAWVYLDSKPATDMRIASKSDATTGAGWGLEWKTATDRFSFRLWQVGGSSALDAPATAFGAPSLATWYFIVGRFNTTTGKGSISVNDGTVTTTAKAGTPGSDSVAFAIGANGDASKFFNGRIDQVGLWKRNLTDVEVTYLYNSGSGRTFAEINSALVGGVNTVTITAPAIPAVDLTMPISTSTITLSAPTVPAVNLTMPVSTNTITLSAPSVPAVNLTMPVSTNTITLSAPTVPSLVLTMPVSACTITLSAPAQAQLAEISLVATTNTITVSAPTVVKLHQEVGPVADIFTDPDSTTLAAHSALWTVQAGAFHIESNSLAIDNPSGTDFQRAYWNDNTFGDDQYAKAVFTTVSNNTYMGVAIRMATGAATYYAFYARTDEWYFFKSIAGSITVLANNTTLFVNGDSIELRAVGDQITAYRNGVLVFNVTDADIASGRAGVAGYDLQNGLSRSTLTSWEASTLLYPTATANVITLSAPAIPAVHLTMPVSTNTVTLSAPSVPAVHLTMPVSTCTITLSAARPHVHTSLTPVYDFFTGPDTETLDTHNSSWTIREGSLEILSNAIRGTGSGDNTALWNDNTFADDQYSKATVDDVEPGKYAGVLVRGSFTQKTLYGFNSDSVGSNLYKWVDNSVHDFATGLTPAVAGDVIEIHAVGTRITALINGVVIISRVDADIASGSPGVTNYSASSISMLTDWEGGEIVNVTLTATANTITLSAPSVPAVHLTMPVSTNTITLSAPSVPAVNLTMPVNTNTITLSAPSIPAVHLTMPVDTSLVTITAPVAVVVPAITLVAVANTITLTAPVAVIVPAITLTVTANVITLTAPAQAQVVAVTLAALASTVTITAPAPVAVHAITLIATANTVTVSAPDAEVEAEGGDVTRQAGQNRITLTAPAIPAVHLTMPVTANVITLSAPAQLQIVTATLLATANLITITAPAPVLTAPVTRLATPNTLHVTAPTALMLVDQTAIATGNVILITAPVVSIALTFNWTLIVNAAVVRILAATPTIQPTWTGELRVKHDAPVTVNEPHSAGVNPVHPVKGELTPVAAKSAIVQLTARTLAQVELTR